MWERSLDSLEIRPISGTEGEVAANSTLFWSPDGQLDWLLFRRRGEAHQSWRRDRRDRVPRAGVASAVRGTRPATSSSATPAAGWSAARHREATRALVTTGGASGQPTRAQGLHLFPVFLRDGQRLLYFRVSRADPFGNGLYVADLRLPPDQQSQTRIIETGFSARYVVSAIGRGTHPLRAQSQRVVGRVRQRPHITIGRAGAGRIVGLYLPRRRAFDASNGRVRVSRRRSGLPDGLARSRRQGDRQGWRSRMYAGLALSPDATRVALTRENKLNRSDQDLWIVDVGRNTTSRFTSDALPESVPAWSADGQSVVFAVRSRRCRRASQGAERRRSTNRAAKRRPQIGNARQSAADDVQRKP